MAWRVLLAFIGWSVVVSQILADNPFPIEDYQQETKETPTRSSIQPNEDEKLQKFLKGLSLKTVVDRNRLYENDLVRVKWVLQYPNVPSLNIDYKITDYHIPTLPDFVKQRNFIPNEGDTENVKSIKVNGENYQEKVLLCFYMSPISAGNYSVGKGDVSIQLFNASGHYIGVPKLLKSPSVLLKVQSLNGKPDNYCGGIGQFSLSEELVPSNSVHVGQSVTYRIHLKGSGNLMYVNAPTLTFPDGVEGYPLKAASHINYDYESCSGERIFDYVIIPQKDTLLTLPSVELSFFNTTNNSFKTLKTKAIRLKVLPKLPSADSLTKRNVETPTDSVNVGKIVPVQGKEASSDGNYWLLLFLLVPFIAVFVLWFRKTKLVTSDIESVSYARLDALLAETQNQTTASPIEKVVKDYLGEKFGTSVSHMVNNLIADLLREQGVTEPLIIEFGSFFDDCSSYGYSPSCTVGYDELVKRAKKLIESLKNEIG